MRRNFNDEFSKYEGEGNGSIQHQQRGWKRKPLLTSQRGKAELLKCEYIFSRKWVRISRIPNVPQIIIATSDKKPIKFFQIKRIYPPGVETTKEYSRYVPT
jgi:hypothetical protein